MAGLENGALQFGVLARHLKDTGQGELRKALYKGINDAARPLARRIRNLEHLKPYMPDRYAAILAADLSVTVSKRASESSPGVVLVAKSAARLEQGRKVGWIDQGFINHPVFATGPREEWRWVNRQTGGMKPGFFSDPVRDCAPQVRAEIFRQMTEVARKATGG